MRGALFGVAPEASGGDRMTYLILFFLVFAAFLIREIAKGMHDDKAD